MGLSRAVETIVVGTDGSDPAAITSPWQAAESRPTTPLSCSASAEGCKKALQSVQVSETPSQVVITVNLAIRREFTEGIYAVTPVLIIERTIVELSEPLGERAIVDGAT